MPGARNCFRSAMVGFVPSEVMSAVPAQEPAVTTGINIHTLRALTVSIGRPADRTALKLALGVIGELSL